MSVQYDQAPNLTFAQQDAIQREYDAHAKNSTTAFLLCYFLGVLGAHRVYLGQWGAAALRLILPLVAVGLAILGVLDILPFATFSLAVITLLCALIWEALDLARIDREVNSANAALMDHLLATRVPPAFASAPESPKQPAAPPPAAPLEPQTLPLYPAPAQPAPASDTALGAGLGAAVVGAALAANAEPSSPPRPEPMPEPAPAAPAFEPEPAPLAVPTHSAMPSESAGGPTLPPTASAYVPPVAPDIVSGGFATPSVAEPVAEPERPPVWPGTPGETPTAPEWPGAYGAQPDQPDQTDAPAIAAPIAAAAAEADTQTQPAVPPPPAQPEAPKLKHIRVRRKITLDDGTVVGEQVLEDNFPIEMDTQEAAKILEARFQQLTLDEIARQANLPPGTDLQLKRE